MARHFSFPIVGVREFCQLETFSASCASDEVILMQYARYGRMRLGRCVKVFSSDFRLRDTYLQCTRG